MVLKHDLLKWYEIHKRDLPWRATKDPYKIWLSEIILQQTRVNQGWNYYLKFVNEYPTVEALANAKESHIINNWQGLGYYSRARNLHFTAKTIVKKHNSVFPSLYKEILALKGIGSYTAAAISSICFNLNYPVVDGNVYRVISRIFGVKAPIDIGSSQKIFQEIAQDQLDTKQPGEYNQALMEFGALQCTPKKPNCKNCPFIESCFAYRNNIIDLLPVKRKKTKVRSRFIIYIVIKVKNGLLITKRLNKDIWQNLFDFPSLEFEKRPNQVEIHNGLSSFLKERKINSNPGINNKWITHKLTHQLLNLKFILYDCDTVDMNKFPNAVFANKEKLNSSGFPIVIWNYIEEHHLNSSRLGLPTLK